MPESLFRRTHRKTSVPEFLFNKVAGLRISTLFKKETRHKCFHVNFAKFLKVQ